MVGRKLPGNLGSCEWIEIACGDTEPFKNTVAITSCRLIGAVGNQDVVAGLHNRKQRRRDGGKSGRQQRDPGAVRAFEVLQRKFERFRGRSAAAAVLVTGAMGDKILGRGVEDRRGMVNRRIDETVVGLGIASSRNQAGIGMALRC